MKYKVIIQPAERQGELIIRYPVTDTVEARSVHFHTDGSIAFYGDSIRSNAHLDMVRAYAAGTWFGILTEDSDREG